MRVFTPAFVLFASSLLSSGQLVGDCPPIAPRSPVSVNELRGVVVDVNMAVVPEEKVKLQILNGKEFRDAESAETDANGQFSFATRRAGQYRLVFSGRVGLCTATIPIKLLEGGLKGMRLTLPVAATDTCPDYCEKRMKVEEMTGREGHE